MVKLSASCTAARQHCARRLEQWNRRIAPSFLPVLTHLLRLLPRLERCNGSLWSFYETWQPPLYDTPFWTCGASWFGNLTPQQLALVYAVLMRHFSVMCQRIENNEKAWTCYADPNTGLPARLPAENGVVVSDSLCSLVSVSVMTNFFTGGVNHIYYNDFRFRAQEDMSTELDVNCLRSLMLASKTLNATQAVYLNWCHVLFEASW